MTLTVWRGAATGKANLSYRRGKSLLSQDPQAKREGPQMKAPPGNSPGLVGMTELRFVLRPREDDITTSPAAGLRSKNSNAG